MGQSLAQNNNKNPIQSLKSHTCRQIFLPAPQTVHELESGSCHSLQLDSLGHWLMDVLQLTGQYEQNHAVITKNIQERRG